MPIQIGHDGGHGFDQPLGLLNDCHRRIERFSHAMLVVSREEKGRALSAAGRSALEQSTTYFRSAAPLHTADEEESLFPLLRAGAVEEDSELADTLDALESEHRSHEAEQARIDELVSRWLEHEQNGLPNELADELIAKLEVLERAYADHIRIEDETLFPAAKRMLGAHELEEIGREMAERRGLPYSGPIARFLGSDHERLHEFLDASLATEGDVQLEPFSRFRDGILRHISMEEKHLIPGAAAAQGGRRPAIAGLLRTDHSAIAALLVPPPTRAIVAELQSILERHDRCEEDPGGLYDTCDRLLGAEASLRLVAEMENHPPVAVKAFNLSPRVARHMQQSVERSWDAWREWKAGRS